MNRKSESLVPPFTKVVTVGSLREPDSDVDSDSFSDETLAEMQILTSRITDEGAQVLISIMVEDEWHLVGGQAELPLDWFGEQMQVRHLINAPSNIASLMRESDIQRGSTATPLRHSGRQFAAIGPLLYGHWWSRQRVTQMLTMSTVAWIGLVGRHGFNNLHKSVKDIREKVKSGKLSIAGRKTVGGFCHLISYALRHTTVRFRKTELPQRRPRMSVTGCKFLYSEADSHLYVIATMQLGSTRYTPALC